MKFCEIATDKKIVMWCKAKLTHHIEVYLFDILQQILIHRTCDINEFGHLS